MNRDRTRLLVAAWCALYALGTTAWYVVWRARFAERSADAAIFENLLWNATHGNGLTCAIEGVGVPHLAVHFSPVLYLLCPLYALFHSMVAIHAIVSATVALAGYAVYRYAARNLDRRTAFMLTMAFTLHPTIVLQTFMEFHEQALAVLPATTLLISWLEDRRGATFTSAAALLLIREDNALLLLGLGVLSLASPARRSVGALLLAAGTAYLWMWRWLAIGALGEGQIPTVFGGTYAQWGDGAQQVLHSMLSRPQAVLRHLVSPDPLRYLATLLVPFLIALPLGSLVSLAALPQLLMILLAVPGSRVYEIRMHYSIVPVVVLFFASLATLMRASAARWGCMLLVRRWAPVGMLALVVMLAPAWAGKAVQRLNPFTAEIRQVLASIPDTSSVTAPGYLLNHLAARPRIALAWDDDILQTEYVILEDSSRFFFKGRTVDVFHSPRLDSLLTGARYSRVLEYAGWHVYRRTPSTSR